MSIFFTKLSKNDFGLKRKIITHPDGFLIYSPTLFSRGIIIFQGVLTKFNFAMKFPIPKKNCRFNEGPKM